MKTKVFSIVLLAISAAFLLTSCDESPAITIELGEVSLDMPLELDSDEASEKMMKLRSYTEEDGTHTFHGKLESLSLDDAMFDEIQSYIDAKDDIKFVLSTIKLFVSSDFEYKITNFTSTTVGLTEEYTFSKDEISINKEYTDKALTEYINNIFSAIQSGENFGIEVSGTVDNPELTAGQTIGILNYMLKLAAEIDTNVTNIKL